MRPADRSQRPGPPLLRTLLALLLCAFPGAAAELAPQGDGDPVGPGLWRLHGTEPSLPQDDLAPLLALAGKATVVGLGESIHTSGGFYQLKHRVIRSLVQRSGYRLLTFETGWVGADKVEAYLQRCAGPPDGPMQSIFGIWQSAEVRDLLSWMCQWNRAHRKPADRLHFMGFDIQNDFGQIAVNATALRALDELFTREAARIQRRTSKKDFAWAKLHRLGLAAWEDVSYLLHRDGLGYQNARDRGMAATFLGLRELRYQKAKAIVWAHNDHLSRSEHDPRTPGTIWMGSYLAGSLGGAYFNAALAAKQTEVDWLFACGPFPGYGADPSIEHTLHELGEGDLLVDLHQAQVIPAGVHTLGDHQVIAVDQWDALLYLERSPKMHPLAWPSCQ